MLRKEHGAQLWRFCQQVRRRSVWVSTRRQRLCCVVHSTTGSAACGRLACLTVLLWLLCVHSADVICSAGASTCCPTLRVTSGEQQCRRARTRGQRLGLSMWPLARTGTPPLLLMLTLTMLHCRSCRAALLRRTRLYARASDAVVAATGSGSSTKTGARKKQRRQAQPQLQLQQPQPPQPNQLPEVLLLQPGTGLVAMSKRQLTALIAAGAVKQLSGVAGDSSNMVAAPTASGTAAPWVQQSAPQLPQQPLPTCQQPLRHTVATVSWQQTGGAVQGASPLSPACSPSAALLPAQQPLLLATGYGAMGATLTASCGGSGSSGSSSNIGGSSIGTYSCNSGSLSASFSRSSGSFSCSGGSLGSGSGCSPSIGSTGSGARACSIASDATLSTSCSRAMGATVGAAVQGGAAWPLPVPELHTWTEKDVSELLADMVTAPGMPVDEMLRCIAPQQVV